MGWYGGNDTGGIPGAFPEKWWEGSALFMSLLWYWHYTGDSTYNDQVSQGMEWQAGNGDYMPDNYSSYLGNDDQMFWGQAAMTAAEIKFPDVEDSYSWLSLAQGVFNTQTARWDTMNCGGGLRWQIFPYQAGYNMKNSVSNGGLFMLAARLARYTNNQTYTDWAHKIWDWSTDSPLVDKETWNVADSTDIPDGCSTSGNNQWSYNYGTYLSGAAYLYNMVRFVFPLTCPVPPRLTPTRPRVTRGKRSSTVSSKSPSAHSSPRSTVETSSSSRVMRRSCVTRTRSCSRAWSRAGSRLSPCWCRLPTIRFSPSCRPPPKPRPRPAAA